ncbi:DedA family protein [Tsukamurella sp. 8F]|uniref:DedA family protein n=1 Tax=unclassified Tsukamurella TaxID=2633480 RepID=UPI0023B9941E|nr:MULTISPECIES: DedA family protein [unclassified Tsukamurella]MDF0531388.1 DedA family protein [Tsukamurella sp. 8J]MDF0585306.1 DedA family protein [Tsukamurella sp. 8F]
MLDSLLQHIPVPAVYALTGFAVGIESLGVPLPGEVILVTAALLSSHHELAVSPHGVAACAVVGACIGDGIGYLVGRRWGTKLFTKLQHWFPHHVNDDLIAYAEHVFARYGVFAVFFGRFVALLRIFAGPLAGSLKMPPARFFSANVLGGICWAAGTVYLVYYLGVVAEKWLKNFSYVGLGIALVFAVLASTVLRRAMNRRVAEFAAQRRVADGSAQEA